MEKTIQEKRKEFLEEGIKYFSTDTRRRATKKRLDTKTIDCVYRTRLKSGKCCFIVRHIPVEVYSSSIENIGLSYGNIVWRSLPSEIQYLGSAFLECCQELHDRDIYWNRRSGLTSLGKRETNRISKQYCNEEI